MYFESQQEDWENGDAIFLACVEDISIYYPLQNIVDMERNIPFFMVLEDAVGK